MGGLAHVRRRRVQRDEVPRGWKEGTKEGRVGTEEGERDGTARFAVGTIVWRYLKGGWDGTPSLCGAKDFWGG